MQNDHLNGCSCYDCLELGLNHADKTVNEYIGGNLKAISPVQILSSPNGALIKSLKAGDVVGDIFSWVKAKDGSIWWQLENNTFVEHGIGRFDLATLENSLKDKQIKEAAKIAAKVEERSKANTSGLYQFGKSIPELPKMAGKLLKEIVIGVIVALVLMYLIKSKS